MHFRVAAKRRERDEQSRRWHTWHIAALPKTKKFPTFRDFVKPAAAAPSAETKPGRQAQTPEQMQEIARSWLSGRKR